MEPLRLETGTERNLVQVLRNRSATFGDRAWLIADEQRVTYCDVERESNRLAHGLRRLGIAPGNTVLILLPNCLEFVYCWCAIAKVSAIEVPLNTAGRGTPLKHQINDSSATVIIVDEEYLDNLELLIDELPALTHCIVRSSHTSECQLRQRVPKLAQRCRILMLPELFTESTGSLPTVPSYRDLTAIIYTSGTTGLAKGVMTTYAHAFEYAAASAAAIRMEMADIHYTALPLFHVAGQWGCLYATALSGATAILSDRFHVGSFWSDIARHHATSTFLLGAMASFLYGQPATLDDYETPLTKVMMVPLIPEVEAFKRRFGLRVSTGYGSTELGGCGLLHILQLPDARSCGKPVSKCEIEIVDDDDEIVPDGVVGEIVARPKEPWAMMRGYWRQPEKTVEAWRNLWFHTGDRGRRDIDGNFYFVDRTKDSIRRRGENISSVEIESEILAHASVLECAVIPVESIDTEQEIMTLVVLKPDMHLTPEQLVRYLYGKIANFMIPRFVEIVAGLPKTETGKVKKGLLRDRGLTESTWDRIAAGITFSG